MAELQNFDTQSEREKSPERLARLRQLMSQQGLDVWLVPHGDEHQNESPPDNARRLAWLTGFTGSASYCVVSRDEAVVLVDGRYTAQVAGQIEPEHFTSGDLTKNPPHKWLQNWLSEKLSDDADSAKGPVNIGFDPWLLTIAEKDRLVKAFATESVELVATSNLIDSLWDDQPHPPLQPIVIHPPEFAGKLALEKISELREVLVDESADLCLLTDPASIAWLFNIRGSDTQNTPVALGYAIIRAEGYPKLFMDKRKMSREVEAYLTQLADLSPPSSLVENLTKLAAGTSVLAQFNKVSTALGDIVTGNDGKLVDGPDPVALPRAIKNETEIAGSRDAHLRDGVAVTKFLCWLDQQQPASIDEIAAVKQLEMLRRETAEKFQSKLMDISFDTISAAGPNGAIVHYRVTDETNRKIENNSLYLVDSGGQYQDGTTDITRTILIGQPPEMAVEDYTLVLKGHIAIALARFPKGTRGIDIDGLARAALWQHGRDYAHGTGHGIGSYLSVHEGPQSISKRGMIEFKPGMIISNEPGFYREGQYGIRLENLVLVRELQEIDGGNVPVMGFETLSLAPFDLRLINAALLNHAELHWLNAYHGWVKRQLTPHLEADDAKWLERATAPLSLELPAASA